MSVSDLFGHLGFVLIALSFLVRDMVWLRLLSVASQVVLIIYNYFGPPEPLWLVIVWSLIFLAINLVQIWLLFRERRPIAFSEQERELYTTVFRSFTPVEYMKLLRIARWSRVEAGQPLATAGQQLDELLLIYNGEASVRRGDQVLARLKDGAFIGEMEFFSRKAATATVIADRPTAFLAWSQTDLRGLLTRNPAMLATLQSVFSTDMVQKLAQAAPSA